MSPFAKTAGGKSSFAEISGNGPPRHFVPPLRRGELYSATVRAEFPSIGGVPQRGGVVREFGIGCLVPCHSRAGGNDKETAELYTYSLLSSRAERGDPVNKEALRANARRHNNPDPVVKPRDDSGGVTSNQ